MFLLWLLLASAAPKNVATPPPLVRIDTPAPPIITTPIYPTWHYQQWSAFDLGDSTMASTKNESGSAFGVACGKECVWFVNFQTECDEGTDYPAMVNAPWGSSAITLRCYHYGDRRLLTYAMDDASLGLLAKGGEVGFAFPLASGKFGVSRFSLSGGTDAVIKALDLIVARRSANQKGLRDFTI